MGFAISIKNTDWCFPHLVNESDSNWKMDLHKLSIHNPWMIYQKTRQVYQQTSKTKNNDGIPIYTSSPCLTMEKWISSFPWDEY